MLSSGERLAMGVPRGREEPMHQRLPAGALAQLYHELCDLEQAI